MNQIKVLIIEERKYEHLSLTHSKHKARMQQHTDVQLHHRLPKNSILPLVFWQIIAWHEWDLHCNMSGNLQRGGYGAAGKGKHKLSLTLWHLDFMAEVWWHCRHCLMIGCFWWPKQDQKDGFESITLRLSQRLSDSVSNDFFFFKQQRERGHSHVMFGPELWVFEQRNL